MRIVDQHQIAEAKARRERRARKRGHLKMGAILLAVVAVGSVWIMTTHKPKQAAAPAEPASSAAAEVKKEPKIADFTPEQFRDLYNTFSYPNTEQITVPPEITSNPEADSKIRTLAEARGYRLRSLAVTGLVPVTRFFSIQPLALQPWLDLQAAATRDGLNLTVAAAYRSVDDQRTLFTEKMAAQGIGAEDIANGSADETVDLILQRTALPGYSRHHTGFTVDLICDEVNLYEFDTSPCYEWLSADNYARTKQFGWVPSYPKGTNSQGPEPESWEYIWVGVDALYAAD